MVEPVPIPPRLARISVAWEADAARAWLADLPRIVADVAAAWDLEVGPPFEPGGNISWVAPARGGAGGVDAVLKVQLPHPESDPEARGLAAWDGAGAVRLLAHDPARCALLLERCRPGHALVDAGGSTEAVRTGAAVGALLHQAPPPDGVPLLRDVLGPWADLVERRLAEQGSWIDPGVVSIGLEAMRTDGAVTPVLLHGDLNPTNVLAAERLPWLAIDPKPMLGDAAYDGARLVLQPDPLTHDDPARTLHTRLDIVAEAMAVERDRLLRWCLADALQMAVGARHRGEDADAARFAAQTDLVRSAAG